MSYWSQHFIKPSVHNLVLCMSLCVHSLYLTLWDPMDCSPSGSSVHRISQARILEWIHISFSRGSSQPRDLWELMYLTLQAEVPKWRNLHFKVPFQCISFPHALQSLHPALLRLSASLIPAVFIDTFAQFTTGCKILFTLSISSD